ncbi:MAG: cytochrome d ubiquinol oxidase subunit II [Acidobacteriota bacterium]|nr:cytochrome d ubiquinol oxidase subunit II [Acidobacteriota bacterium]
MPELWYAIAVLMLTAYVVLDGFDFGAGALHLFVAKTDSERRQVLAAIGPYWDGNEVWLLAAGGALFVSFPKVLSSGISGFYFAIFLVLWSLILRGIAIEFRSHVNDSMWRRAWDVGFAVASILLPVFFGAALGNLIRGVPLDPDGWFELALFTDFTARDPVGILDWYTVLVGIFALTALVGHGATFLAWKTDGSVHERSRALVRRLHVVVAVLWVAVTAATTVVNPDLLAALPRRPLAIFLAAGAAAGLATVFAGSSRGHDRAAFLGSSSFLAGLSTATATCVFPVMLRSTSNPALSLTAHNAGGDPAGLRTAVGWLAIGLPLAVLYFVIVFRLHRGKAVAAAEGEGY